MEVFLLYHINKLNEDDFKLIGVYSSKGNAEKAKQRAKLLRGFVNSPDSFLIDKCKLDDDNWQEGFITIESDK